MKTQKPKIPLTIEAKIAANRAEQAEVHAFIRGVERDIAEKLQEQFVSRGGCNRCRGRGWVVTWDTLDYMDGSAATYGSCPDESCTEETRAHTGLSHAPDRDDLGFTKHDYNQGVGPRIHSHHAWEVLTAAHRERYLRLAEENRQLRARLEPRKSDRVVVTKGRKAPIGFVGTLFWTKPTQWGTRIGVKADDGTVQWTYLSNVRKVA